MVKRLETIYRQHQTELAPVDPGEVAQQSIQKAILQLAHAFNTLNWPDVPYTFDAESVERVMEISLELRALHSTGGFQPKLVPLAQADHAFQRFMGRTVGNQTPNAAAPPAG